MAAKIKIAGLDYKSASVGVREKFAFTESEQRALLHEIAQQTEEAVLISTCNRTELVVVSEEEPAELLRRARGCGEFFSLEGESAVARLFEIAAGLHSQIPLEDQILGQMKSAEAISREEKRCGPLLGRLFRLAVTAGKEIRTKQKNMPRDCSAASAAVSAAEDELGSLKGVKALIVGSGEMGMLAARLLRERGANVRMTIRRHRKDGAKPPQGVDVISYDDRFIAMRECRIVICATASPHLVLTAKDFPDDGRPLLMIDLAVPRDIDPLFAERPNVRLIDMDGLGRSALPEEFLAEINENLAAHIEQFEEWLKVRESLPEIEEICSFAEREIIRGLGCEDSENRARTAEAAHAMMNKLLFSLKERVGIDMAKDCYRALAKAAQK